MSPYKEAEMNDESSSGAANKSPVPTRICTSYVLVRLEGKTMRRDKKRPVPEAGLCRSALVIPGPPTRDYDHRNMRLKLYYMTHYSMDCNFHRIKRFPELYWLAHVQYYPGLCVGGLLSGLISPTTERRRPYMLD